MEKNRDKNMKIIEIKYDLANEKGKYLETIHIKFVFSKTNKDRDKTGQ